MDVQATAASASSLRTTTHTPTVATSSHPCRADEFVKQQHPANDTGHLPAQAALQESPGASDQTPQYSVPAPQAKIHNMQAGCVGDSSTNSMTGTPTGSLSMFDSARIAQQISATLEELQQMKASYNAAVAQADQYYQRVFVLEAEKQQLSTLLAGAQNDIVMLAERLAVAQQKLNQSKAMQDEVQQLRLQLSYHQAELLRLQEASMSCNPAAGDPHKDQYSKLPSEDVALTIQQPEKANSSSKDKHPADYTHSLQQRNESQDRGRTDADFHEMEKHDKHDRDRVNHGGQDYAVASRHEIDQDMLDQGSRKRLRSSLKGSETAYFDSKDLADPHMGDSASKKLQAADSRQGVPDVRQPSTDTRRLLLHEYEDKYSVRSRVTTRDGDAVQQDAEPDADHYRANKYTSRNDTHDEEHAVYSETTGRSFGATQHSAEEFDTRRRSAGSTGARGFPRVAHGQEYVPYTQKRMREYETEHQRHQDLDTRQRRYSATDVRDYTKDEYEQGYSLSLRPRTRERPLVEDLGTLQKSPRLADALSVPHGEHEQEYDAYFRRHAKDSDIGQHGDQELAVRRRNRVVSHIQYEEEYAVHPSGRGRDCGIRQRRDSELDACDRSSYMTDPRRSSQVDHKQEYSLHYDESDQQIAQHRQQMRRSTKPLPRVELQSQVHHDAYDDRYDVYEEKERPRTHSRPTIERDRHPGRDAGRLHATRDREPTPIWKSALTFKLR